jgi:hypothetical protein
MIEIIFDYPAELAIYLPEAPDLVSWVLDPLQKSSE